MSIEQQLATELSIKPAQVAATLTLLDQGATLPFIARYRKEQTGALDDTQLRQLHERLGQLRDLESRRTSILDRLREQNQLTPELEQALNAADSRARLEDLYLPYRPKRRNKAQEAREAGLEPLAQQALKSGTLPRNQLGQHLNPDAGFADPDAVAEGVRQILLETLSEDAELIGSLRQRLWQQGELQVRAAKGKADPDSKFRDYFDYAEPIARIPSHRALAVLRGVNESVLKTSLQLPESLDGWPEEQMARRHQLRSAQLDDWMQQTLQQAWSKKLRPSLETELIKQLREQADQSAIDVFARNLKDLLLAAPAGAKATIGLDPGLRTGVKVAVIDATGKLVDHTTIYPHAPQKQWDRSLHTLTTLAKKHAAELIAVGNGTASRETEQLAQAVCKAVPHAIQAVLVNEAGASIYSASALAAAEFPDLDVTIRGAVSIARRLQDPLAELVKIDPKSIGVGQYQHDVDQKRLGEALDSVIEHCVNHVGVDVNTASAALLSHVAGLNRTTADNIVAWRDEQGALRNRRQLLKVPRLGPKAYEQCAGFLRIRDGEEPLDNSAVHPESYPLAQAIAASCGLSLEALLKQPERLKQVDPAQLEAQGYGRYTVRDVISELEKPGRDPRPEFRSVHYAEGVETLKDLQPGMTLEGVVTNVTHFGAFVDIGVHQDGLVHISQLADRFVSDPHTLVSSGQIVKVRVLEVDEARKRISLTMKSGDAPVRPKAQPDRSAPAKARASADKGAPVKGSLADKLMAAGVKGKR
ncbi:RNA-binding transcriptional accessory protein [Marinobacterium sp. AK62]|uniref:RNA-binding transcriptional accessory protein n=1 Tax=Marinobacterium alkalitolerans TaxID=1542925 RepID=A0ABS3ZEZ3_9GAMM|nr:Tex family protein [Marinobacterium alkalitolerans]MBP0049619.1 RNA-binding transcriptional accessory protein [Marinobacterium alkalitolerans]